MHPIIVREYDHDQETPQSQTADKIKYFYLPFQGGTSFVDHSCYIWYVFVMLSCASVYCCLVVTCLERADRLAIVCGVLLLVCYFPIGILSQMWYLIVSIPNLCPLSYFVIFQGIRTSMQRIPFALWVPRGGEGFGAPAPPLHPLKVLEYCCHLSSSIIACHETRYDLANLSNPWRLLVADRGFTAVRLPFYVYGLIECVIIKFSQKKMSYLCRILTDIDWSIVW